MAGAFEHLARQASLGRERRYVPYAEARLPVWRGLVFRSRDRLLAVAAHDVLVSLALQDVPVTRIPHVSPWVFGLAFTQGEAVPTLDLGACLWGHPTEPTSRTRLLVVQVRGRPHGLVVDEVLRVAAPEKQDVLVEPPDMPETLAGFIEGGFRDRGQVVLVFSVRRLLAHDALRRVAA